MIYIGTYIGANKEAQLQVLSPILSIPCGAIVVEDEANYLITEDGLLYLMSEGLIEVGISGNLPENSVITEDEAFYLLTEDGLVYLILEGFIEVGISANLLENVMITEDELNYLLTEDELFYLIPQ
jgi:hypothetical protein